MATRKTARKAVRKAAAKRRPGATATRRTTARRSTAGPRTKRDPLLAPLKDVTRRTVGNVHLEIGRAGTARVKRVVYPPGFRWSTNMKPSVRTELCMHAHVGFLARGRFRIEYADGCILDYTAPQIVVIAPGHDGWVIGREPAVLIEFDFEKDTIARLGMPDAHRHD